MYSASYIGPNILNEGYFRHQTTWLHRDYLKGIDRKIRNRITASINGTYTFDHEFYDWSLEIESTNSLFLTTVVWWRNCTSFDIAYHTSEWTECISTRPMRCQLCSLNPRPLTYCYIQSHMPANNKKKWIQKHPLHRGNMLLKDIQGNLQNPCILWITSRTICTSVFYGNHGVV